MMVINIPNNIPDHADVTVDNACNLVVHRLNAIYKDQICEINKINI